MKAKKKSGYQGSFLLPTLREQLDARQGIYKLGEKIPWKDFETEFGSFYSEEGRPAKPIRLMVGLLLLKQMHNLGDETVVEQWVQNPYFQFFCGQEEFCWSPPCEPSDLVHFRHRVPGPNYAPVLKGLFKDRLNRCLGQDHHKFKNFAYLNKTSVTTANAFH